MNRLNERQIIEFIQKKLNNSKFVSEDVETFSLGKSNFIAKVDTLVSSTDIPPQMKLKDAARKSVVACISDFASKGVKPQYGMVSLVIPKKFSKTQINSLADGLAKAAKEFKFKLVGGDTNEGKELVIHVSVFGTSKKIIPRRGAKSNDIIITTGPFGYTLAGLKILLNKKKSSKEFSKKAKKSIFRPMPRLDFGIRNKKFFTSSMDSSDGLSTTLHEMAKQSKKKFVITKLPTSSEVFEFAKTNRINFLDLIFNGGEEYEILATVNPHNISKVRRIAKSQKIPLFEIGFVKNGSGVVYKTDTKTTPIKNEGWVHLRS